MPKQIGVSDLDDHIDDEVDDEEVVHNFDNGDIDDDSGAFIECPSCKVKNSLSEMFCKECNRDLYDDI